MLTVLATRIVVEALENGASDFIVKLLIGQIVSFSPELANEKSLEQNKWKVAVSKVDNP